MAWQALSGREIQHEWVPLRQISPRLLQAVVVSEDARFCSHYGIDIAALEHAIRDAQARGGLNVRGGSTISMQVVKNLFLWQEKSLGRKGVELMLTPLMEFILPKHRILEIYLNIAEWGPGIFGVEAAAQYHFRRSAARLNAQQSALLAAALPNPIIRRAGRPGTRVQRQARRVFKRAVRPGRILSCLPKGINRR